MAFDPPPRLPLDMRVADDAIRGLAALLGTILLIVFWTAPLHALPGDLRSHAEGQVVMHWVRLLLLMWLLLRIDANCDLVIIGGYDTEENCRIERKWSLWGLRVFCASAKTRTMLQ